ncbi:hypothetical protein N657DRAFT_641385 [Parathielavia appendiculata]|uniref:Uncharacterized protein n=1 Tax=Parathielavia appendiculata TaxID=2587402 RepID=A0AAN6Z6D6_9PEZI|nr:hypothetical protein N657DRAFT_641385 [Parathielavia appendiculata]
MIKSKTPQSAPPKRGMHRHLHHRYSISNVRPERRPDASESTLSPTLSAPSISGGAAI